MDLTVSSPALDDVVLFDNTVKICPNITEIEFSCTAENVTELTWSRVRMNETEKILTIHVRNEPPFETPHGYTVYLDNSTAMADQFLFATITSRLRVASVSDLIYGVIECSVFDIAEQMIINESLTISLQGKCLFTVTYQ